MNLLLNCKQGLEELFDTPILSTIIQNCLKLEAVPASYQLVKR